MYERFTDRARKVMQLANEEARRFSHEYIGTEHVLLGLVEEGSGVAANVLKNLDVSLPRIRTEIEKIVQHGPPPDIRPTFLQRLFGATPDPTLASGRLPQTPRMKKVIELSIEEARNLRHNYVGTEHLLLGLLRETEGVAAQVLINLGLTCEYVRDEVMRILGIGDSILPRRRITTPEPQQPAITDTSEPLTNDELRTLQELIDQLQQQKEEAVMEQDFRTAGEFREREFALARLIAYYHHLRGSP